MPESSGSLFHAHGNMVDLLQITEKARNCWNLSFDSVAEVSRHEETLSLQFQGFQTDLEIWAKIRKDLINRTMLTHVASAKNVR